MTANFLSTTELKNYCEVACRNRGLAVSFSLHETVCPITRNYIYKLQAIKGRQALVFTVVIERWILTTMHDFAIRRRVANGLRDQILARRCERYWI